MSENIINKKGNDRSKHYDLLFLLDRLEKYKEITARPYALLKDLTDAGLELRDDTDEILSYAHKLRLAGVDKESQIRHCIAYQKTLQRKNENTKDQI